MHDASGLRQLCLILAAESATPIPYWMEMPLVRLQKWIEALKQNRAAAKRK